MLIVKRQVGESIIIADNIVITVICQRGNTVQLGIEAPKETLVLRQELATLNAPLSQHEKPVEVVEREK